MAKKKKVQRIAKKVGKAILSGPAMLARKTGGSGVAKKATTGNKRT